MDDFDDYEEDADDDVFDYMVYEEMQGSDNKKPNQGNTGCSVLLLVLGGTMSGIVWGAVQIIRAVF